ncbi:MAG: glycosyl transferase [Rhodospirillaceae bacterium]|nr:glycosyl transferase [Rhodospirillaceae bacterium]
MRITHIIAGSRYGGAEKFFTDLTTSLSGHKLHQHVITRPFPERLSCIPKDNLHVTRAKLGSSIDLLSKLKVRRSIELFVPDVIMAWMNRGAAFLPNGPWIKVGRLGGYYNLKYYSKCDHLICNTPDIVNYCIDNGWSKEKTHYIPNFSPQNSDQPVPRKTLNTPPDAATVVILARLEKSKGIDVAIQALTYLPNIFLWIAGEGSQKAELLKLAKSLKLNDRVKFLGWRADRDALLKSADICLIPSRTEPFGNVILNAWANSTPVISTATKGGCFLIKNGQNGVLAPINDPKRLSELMSKIIVNKSYAKSLVDGGVKSINTNFSEKMVTEKYINFFKKLTKIISPTKK